MNIIVTTSEGMKQITGVGGVQAEVSESGNLLSLTFKDQDGSDIAYFAGHSFVCWQKS